MAAGGEPDVDGIVRRADPDRWLASRFIADPRARADVVALYAFDLELERARRVTTSALTAEIRLTWWWEVIGEIFDGGRVREHPLARTLADVVRRRQLPRDLLEPLIDARIVVLGAATLDRRAARLWADSAGGSMAVLAAGVLDPNGRREAARPAGGLIGLAALIREGRLERQAGHGLIRDGLPAAAAGARSLAPVAFPAVAAAALARAELAGRPQSEIGRRQRMVWAAIRGRI